MRCETKLFVLATPEEMRRRMGVVVDNTTKER
jgi:hypothetical protein